MSDVKQIQKLGYYEQSQSFTEKELKEFVRWEQDNNIKFREFEVYLDGEYPPYKVYALDLNAVKLYIYEKFIVNSELSFRVFEITRTKVLDFEMGYYKKI